MYTLYFIRLASILNPYTCVLFCWCRYHYICPYELNYIACTNGWAHRYIYIYIVYVYMEVLDITYMDLTTTVIISSSRFLGIYPHGLVHRLLTARSPYRQTCLVPASSPSSVTLKPAGVSVAMLHGWWLVVVTCAYLQTISLKNDSQVYISYIYIYNGPQRSFKYEWWLMIRY